MARTTPGPVDLVIVGSGPAGLYALFHAGFRGLSAALCESHFLLGGQLAVLYPSIEIRRGKELAPIRADDCIRALREQAFQFGAEVRSRARVGEIVDLPDGDLEIRGRSAPLRARFVLLATGAGALLPRRPGAAPPFRHRIGDPAAYRGRRVMVCGSTAADAHALTRLAETASALTVVQPRGVIPGLAPAEQAAFRERAEFLPHGRLVRVDQGADGALVVTLQRGHSSWFRETREVDDLVLANEQLADLRDAANWGVEISGPGLSVDGTGRTSRDRIYACGDAAMHAAKVYSLKSTHDEAARAVEAIAARLAGARPAGAGGAA